MNRSVLERACGVLLLSLAMAMPTLSDADEQWTATWAAVPDSEGPPLSAQTVRQVIRTSIGGSSVRLRLSNLFGAAPITLGPVYMARHGMGSSIRAGSGHLVTFGGKPTVTIARGADALSDTIAFPVAALEELTVSLYVPGRVEPSTIHGTAIQTAYIAAGDATAATALPAGGTDTSRYFLTDVEVTSSEEAHALVVLGDSITDGVGSTPDHNRRWTDVLAARLRADPALASIAVVNSGIAGNRILNDGVDPFVGPSSLSRFDRDVLSKPGVRWILLLQGSNDISAAGMLPSPQDHVSAQQVIDGLKQLVARARARGIKVWGATLLPLAGAGGGFDTPAGQADRRTVNQWIRTAGAFDAVIDFNLTTRDPARPDRLLPAFDSGDHVHPNDAGYEAMAASIDLQLFGSLSRRRPCVSCR